MLDLDDLEAVPATDLSLNDIGWVSIRLAAPLPVETYASPSGGSFLLIDAHDGRTVAAGMAEAPAAVPPDRRR